MKREELDAMPPLAEEFARHKRVVQGCSSKTVDEYLIDLRMFFRYLVCCETKAEPTDEELASADIRGLDASDFESVAPSKIYDFMYYLASLRGDGAKTRARKLSSVKAFYKYLTSKKRYFENNPCVNIETPKMKKQLPKFLSLEESRRLLDAVNNDTSSKTRVRDYAIITLFLNCGMRLSELTGINLRDVDHDLRSLRVTGKGSKERVIYLNDACRSALGVHLTCRLSTPAKPGENALFLSSRGSRISVKTVQYMVGKYLDAAGLGNKGFSTHKLRHTAATLMYQTGEVDIRVLKDILGHEQLNTTQIYTHVSDKGMETAMSKNPLSSVIAPQRIDDSGTLPKIDSPDQKQD